MLVAGQLNHWQTSVRQMLVSLLANQHVLLYTHAVMLACRGSQICRNGMQRSQSMRRCKQIQTIDSRVYILCSLAGGFRSQRRLEK